MATRQHTEQNQETSYAKGTAVLGVTGSIAAYKAAALTSQLTKAGVNVQVVMTPSAGELIQPRTFLTVSQNNVITDLWEMPEWEPQHISLAEKADLVLVAPATANILGKYTHGIGDEALSTLLLAVESPLLFAPAMNPRMWRNPAIQENVARLKKRNCRFIGPAKGHVACRGETAEAGRMVEPEEITQAALALLAVGKHPEIADSSPKRILITAGPTREHIDPVRFISNPSSGKTGAALALVAALFGHEVTLVSGPGTAPPPTDCNYIPVTSAAQMHEAALEHSASSDIIILSAAVADVTPTETADSKQKKASFSSTLKLTHTEDIAADIAKQKFPDQTLVGFAAETDNLVKNAKTKLERKNLDLIAANDISVPEQGFASDKNSVVLVSRNNEIQLPGMFKIELAAHLLESIFKHRKETPK